MRYFIEFAYNGKNFHGFQSQPDAASVQETLEKALSTLFRETIAIVGAGRTDSGVHAKQMYAHFETELELDSDYWTHKLNSFLPQSIVVYRIFKVAEDAHARFDATSRTYEYYIHTFKDAFITDGSWYHSHHLDLDKMNEVVTLLLQYKDFSPLSKHNPDNKTTLCDISHALWVHDEKEGRLRFEISANRFLWNMVRMITGLSLMVGRGRMNLEHVKNVMDEVGTFQYIMPVPPQGLYLTKVEYPYL